MQKQKCEFGNRGSYPAPFVCLTFLFSCFICIRADSPRSFHMTEQGYLTDDEYVDDNAGEDGGVDDDDLTAHNKSVYTPLSLSAPLSCMPLVKVMNRFL